MPQVEITIGGRSFEVACQEGEEPYLRAAAKLLDDEAGSLSSQIGRMPESRMLLMAGLMIADKTAALEDQLRVAEAKTAELVHRLDAGDDASAQPGLAIPEGLADRLGQLADRAEALAAEVEAKAGGS